MSDDETNIQNKNTNKNERKVTLSSKKEETKSILSSKQNPKTIKRKTENMDGDGCCTKENEVTWHKRVNVHRVPKSDSSRSQFNNDNNSNDSQNRHHKHQAQCCTVL
jgi:hypothetical protein